MDKTLVAIVIVIGIVLITIVLSPKSEDSNKPVIEKCVANNGVPVFDNWNGNKIIDCKIYLEK